MSSKRCATPEGSRQHRGKRATLGGFKHVYTNKRRKIVWAHNTNPRKGMKRLSVKVLVWDEWHINLAAQELQDKLMAEASTADATNAYERGQSEALSANESDDRLRTMVMSI